jgi:hypothetical protein
MDDLDHRDPHRDGDCVVRVRQEALSDGGDVHRAVSAAA